MSQTTTSIAPVTGAENATGYTVWLKQTTVAAERARLGDQIAAGGPGRAPAEALLLELSELTAALPEDHELLRVPISYHFSAALDLLPRGARVAGVVDGTGAYHHIAPTPPPSPEFLAELRTTAAEIAAAAR